MLPIRDLFQTQIHLQIESERMEKRLSCKWRSKESRGSKTYIRQNDFKTKTATRHIIIKGTIQQGGITIVNIYAPNMGAPEYIKQLITSIKEPIDNNTVIVGDFNTPAYINGQII